MSKFLPSDSLLACQPFFIKDIITADQQLNQHPLLFKTKTNKFFQKVKLNGVVVSHRYLDSTKVGSQTRCILCLDDGTDVIQVHLSKRLCKRVDAKDLTEAVSLTIIGDPQLYNDTIIIVCKGYRIELDPLAELCHWLEVINIHRNSNNTDIKRRNSSCTSTQLYYLQYGEGKRQKQRTVSNLFLSLSSQPSPIRGSTDSLYLSPSQQNDVTNNNQIDRDVLQWHWSPDHIIATSTPIKQTFSSSPNRYIASPLHTTQTASRLSSALQPQQDEENDSFGFIDDTEFDAMDLDDLEKKALEGRIA
ncbi:uncharacterized protein BX664DRAFT_339103 [Halteromyces radiatus]|uniref:uncharacterized protein n=1 Tax=Halteromyces radiatus TaxID=101107 RepID=UPI00221F4B5A|nr:uncharacterized protein BX664DRAFT_339103 [Halteromyces radiatus]KAI8082805.1 hypothetical protein BX664DRAFT_339103 [Halteromyces radiatus]